HSGTKRNEQQQLLTNGGRIIAVTSLADNLATAIELSKQNAETILFEGKYYRSDIGYEFVKK
ncbi:MAG: phosphoribosylglycinamide synthetase C domain-containing protein, partial [Bacteroidota bacterium]